MKNSIKLTLMAAFAGLALTAITANANTITLANFGPGFAEGGGSGWRYTYTLASSTLMPGDFFTINDFGPATVELPPVGPAPFWTFSQAFTGPNSLPAADDPSVLNVTFTWGGPTYIDISFGDTFGFILDSPLGALPQSDDYTSLDHASTGGPSKASGSVFGPNVANVPDGGSAVALLGIALAGLEGARRLIRARKA